MKLVSVNHVYKSITTKEGQWYNPFKDKHLYIEGIFNNRFLYNFDNDNEVTNKLKIDIDRYVVKIINRLLKKYDLEYPHIRLICKLKYWTEMRLSGALRVELLDDFGNIVDVLEVGDSSIPKGLKDEV
jgi:hypothetical protein